jgi:hypothetical protein
MALRGVKRQRTPRRKALTGTIPPYQNGCPLAIIMKRLAERIERELKAETARIGHCAIYEDELQRLWPLNTENRKAKIEQFAKEHGFKLSFYKEGLCAIFERDAPIKTQ